MLAFCRKLHVIFFLLVARVLLRHFITIKFILVSFVLFWFFYLFFFKRGGGVIAFALLSVHKSAMELRSLHRDSESNYFFCFSECQNYQVLSNADRKVTNDDTPLLCDNTLGPAWFRFQGDAGTKMPTSCIPSNKCGTHATGWLNGTHPETHEGNVTRRVCFHWHSNCCEWSVNIQVQNCSGYYLYYFSGTYPGHQCHLRFCGTD